VQPEKFEIVAEEQKQCRREAVARDAQNTLYKLDSILQMVHKSTRLQQRVGARIGSNTNAALTCCSRPTGGRRVPTTPRTPGLGRVAIRRRCPRERFFRALLSGNCAIDWGACAVGGAKVSPLRTSEMHNPVYMQATPSACGHHERTVWS
jgi:hypothetical protein